MEKAYRVTLLQPDMVKSIDVDSLIKREIVAGKIPHGTSQPLLTFLDGKLYLAAFTLFFSSEDLRMEELPRPSLWCIADVKTGEIIKTFSTSERDFSDADDKIKYSMKHNGDYETSKAYYEKTFSLLDEVREEYLKTGQVDLEKYEQYLSRILRNIPEAYHRFFRELSIHEEEKELSENGRSL